MFTGFEDIEQPADIEELFLAQFAAKLADGYGTGLNLTRYDKSKSARHANTRHTRTSMTLDDIEWTHYHDNDDVEELLALLETSFPNVVETFTPGESCNDDTIWGVRIMANVSLYGVTKPAVRLTANMHGNEVVGRELLLHLATVLAWAHENASTLPWDTDMADELANLVDMLDIWIIPTINPTGFDDGTRLNDDGIDINRDFPSVFLDTRESAWRRWVQHETDTYMDAATELQFGFGLDFFGGALGVSYPYDGNSMFRVANSPTADDWVFRHFAEVYARNNTHMYSNSGFHEGIVNGAEWFPTYRTAADWSYSFTGTPVISAYVSSHKWPLAATLPTYWLQNRQSIVAFLEELCYTGVRGGVSSNNQSHTLPTLAIEIYPYECGVGDDNMYICDQDDSVPATKQRAQFVSDVQSMVQRAMKEYRDCDVSSRSMRSVLRNLTVGKRSNPFNIPLSAKPIIEFDPELQLFSTYMTPGIYVFLFSCARSRGCHFCPNGGIVDVSGPQTDQLVIYLHMNYVN